MITKAQSLNLLNYKEEFEIALKEAFAVRFGEKNLLKDACEYALLSEGKRIRALIVIIVAECLGKNPNVMDAALSMEYGHAASLIADDLPCMDDDAIRRCKPALHKIYGETIAILTTYALISASYESIYLCCETMKKHVIAEHAEKTCMLALKYASFLSGAMGLTGGQYLDLFEKKLTLNSIKKIILQKTVSGIVCSFVFGWLFGCGDISKLQFVEKMGSHFGMAFQIADDILDMDQDREKEKHANIALLFGKEKTLELFEEEIKGFSELSKQLNLKSPSMKTLKELLINYAGV